MSNRFNDVLPEDFERNDGKATCRQCQRDSPVDGMAELDGLHFCSICLDPKQPAFDYVVAMIERMGAEIAGLKAERRKLTAQINMMRRAA